MIFRLMRRVPVRHYLTGQQRHKCYFSDRPEAPSSNSAGVGDNFFPMWSTDEKAKRRKNGIGSWGITKPNSASVSNIIVMSYRTIPDHVILASNTGGAKRGFCTHRPSLSSFTPSSDKSSTCKRPRTIVFRGSQDGNYFRREIVECIQLLTRPSQVPRGDTTSDARVVLHLKQCLVEMVSLPKLHVHSGDGQLAQQALNATVFSRHKPYVLQRDPALAAELLCLVGSSMKRRKCVCVCLLY
jgi:hypothetical protein